MKKDPMLEYLIDTRQSLLGQVAAIERYQRALENRELITCSVCGRTLLTKDGMIPQHNKDGIICRGSGQARTD